MNKKNIKKNKGFTLIEILIVIGIIAVLAAIVLVAINPARQFRKANNSQRTANVNAILNAVGQYIVDNKGTLPNIPDGELDEDLCNDLVPTYIPAIPTDPDSDSEGKSISVCSDVDSGEVEYEVDDDSTGRVTVSAPLTVDEDDGDISSDPIEVTR